MSVTVIAWLLIGLSIVAVLVLVGAIAVKGYEPGLGHLVLFVLLSAALQLIIGAGLLQGGNWARVLFLWAVPISIVIELSSGFVTMGTAVRIVLYVVFAFYLTRPAAVDYFRRAEAAGSER